MISSSYYDYHVYYYHSEVRVSVHAVRAAAAAMLPRWKEKALGAAGSQLRSAQVRARDERAYC